MTRIASKATKRNGKGKRWLKGESSSSNPTITKHRNKAGLVLSGESTVFGAPKKLTLTKDVLEKFDAVQQQKQRIEDSDGLNGNVDNWLTKSTNDDDDDSVIGDENHETISIGNASAASVWTNCTNISFDRFLNGFNPKSRIHKAMLAVLATVREAIAMEKGSETETEYFAGLMLTLNCVQSEEKLTATLSLIKMVLKRLDPSVLRAQFSETSNILIKLLMEQLSSSTPNCYLVKSILSSLSTLLKHQENAIWQLKSTQNIFNTLLMLILHGKPRIRKAANFAVLYLVCDDSEDFQVCSKITRSLTAIFCINKLEEHLTTSSDEHLNILLYILGLLSDTMNFFPNVKYTKKVSEAILSHMTLGNVLVVTGAFQTFYSFFLRKPDSNVLSAELNARLINALYDYQPNINDEQPLKAWCTTLKEALLSLYQLDAKLHHQHLFKFIKTSIACLQSDSTGVHSIICNSIKIVLQNALQDIDAGNSEKLSLTLVKNIYSELEFALKYQYSHAWVCIVPLLGELIHSKLVDSVGLWMQRLAIIRDSNHSDINAVIDDFFGLAIQTYGPKVVLQYCPVSWSILSTSDNFNQMDQSAESYRGEFSNPWLLPILRDKTCDFAELSLIENYFFPLAEELSKKVSFCESLSQRLQKINVDQMEVDDATNSLSAEESCLVMLKELKRCAHAIWALLPSFCRNPIDVPEVFAKIAKKIGDILYDKELCVYGLSALHNLFKCNSDVQNEVAKFSKNYLPILFNMYTNENENSQIEEGMRLSVLKLVHCFIPHLFAHPNTVPLFRTFYERILSKLNEKNSEYRKIALFDLLRVFLSSPTGLTQLDIENVYYKLAKPLIDEHDTPTEQKKGFRFIEEITCNKSTVCRDFLRAHFDEHVVYLFKLFSKQKNLKSPSARSLALKCLHRLVEEYLLNYDDAVTIDWLEFFDNLLLIIFKNLQLKSAKARRSAKDSLLLMADGFKQLSTIKNNQTLTYKLIRMIIDPLANDGDLIEKVMRVNAMSILYVNKYHQPLVPKDIECLIADAILALIPNSIPENVSPNVALVNTRTITKICIEFIRQFFSHTTPDMLNTYLEVITCNITRIPIEVRRKFYMDIKLLLLKLIRRFGFVSFLLFNGILLRIVFFLDSN